MTQVFHWLAEFCAFCGLIMGCHRDDPSDLGAIINSPNHIPMPWSAGDGEPAGGARAAGAGAGTARGRAHGDARDRPRTRGRANLQWGGSQWLQRSMAFHRVLVTSQTPTGPGLTELADVSLVC